MYQIMRGLSSAIPLPCCTASHFRVSENHVARSDQVVTNEDANYDPATAADREVLIVLARASQHRNHVPALVRGAKPRNRHTCADSAGRGSFEARVAAGRYAAEA